MKALKEGQKDYDASSVGLLVGIMDDFSQATLLLLSLRANHLHSLKAILAPASAFE